MTDTNAITLSDRNGSLSFIPDGKILAVLNAQTRENRAKLEAHIRRRLLQGLHSIERFGFGTPESIEDILDPEAARAAEEASAERWDAILKR